MSRRRGETRGGSAGTLRRGRSRRPPRTAGLALVLALAAACGGDDAATTGRPDDVPGRRLLSARWDTLFRVGGGADDSVFAAATRIGADASGVSLADGYAGRVVRVDRRGRVRWSFGRRGGGPDEFRAPRDIAVDNRGRTWVLDVANARITVLDAAGRPAFRVPLGRLERRVDALAPLPGDRAALFALDPDAPFVVVGRDGEPEARRPFPWPGLERLSVLATQMKLASAGGDGGWAAAFSFGDGFQIFDADGAPRARGWFPEEVPFPRVEVRTSGPGIGRKQRVSRIERPRKAAAAVTMSEERLYVLFGGTGPGAGRWVDSYSTRDGSYAGSYLLPRPVKGVAHGDGVFYVAYDGPYPTLAAWRPAPAP